MQKTKENKTDFVIFLTESAIMLALAFILSLFKLFDLPYGGSITLASMLPVVVIGYRHGVLKGFFCGLVFGALQLFLGMGVLSYATSAWAAAAIICFDYIIAFALCGLAGAFRKMENKTLALVLGALTAAFTRYLCHVATGATVWAGLSIPTEYALKYSLIYNATYMLPETIVLTVVAFYLSSILDLSSKKVGPARRRGKLDMPTVAVGGGLACAFVVYCAVTVFSRLQNSETGEFDIRGIETVPPLNIVVALGIALLSFVLFVTIRYIIIKNRKKSEKN